MSVYAARPPPELPRLVTLLLAQGLITLTVVLLLRGDVVPAVASASALCGVVSVWAASRLHRPRHDALPRDALRSARALCRVSAVVALFLAVVAVVTALDGG